MPKKILIIDDDPITVKYLDAIFQNNGYQTCTAADGVAALDVLKEEMPDLITLDLVMPEETGPRFYRRMSKDPDLKNIPVIVISGMASRELSIKKVVASLHKPFDPDELIEIVKNTIG